MILENFLGKDRQLKFNQGTLIEFQSKVNPTSIDATSGYALIWAAVQSHCFVNGTEFTKTVDDKEVPVTFEQCCDAVDELTDETITGVLTAFQESTVYQKKLKPVIEEEEKKSDEIAVQEIQEQTAIIEQTASESPEN